MKNYYKILSIEKNSTQEEIKKAFRKLAKKFHPDVNQNSNKSQEIFKELNEAYSVLSDENKKAEYNRRLFGGSSDKKAETNSDTNKQNNNAYTPRNNMSYSDFTGTSDIFENYFGFNPKNNSPNVKKTDENIKPIKTSEAFEKIFGKKRF